MIVKRDSELSGKSASNSIKDKIDALVADGGTNTHAGLMEAQNMLDKDTEADVKYVVLLSDGVPTTHIEKNKQGKLIEKGDGLETNASRHTEYPINQSTEIKTTATVYTIALSAGKLGESTLQQIASDGKYVATNDSGELKSIFSSIAGEITSNMKDPKVVDPMGDGFKISEASIANITTDPKSSEVSYDRKDKVLSWNPGTLTPHPDLENIKYAEIKYRIEIDDDIFDAKNDGGKYATNGDAKVTYTEANGKEKILFFPKPKVDPVLWIVDKQILNHRGDVIDTQTGEFGIKATNYEDRGVDSEGNYLIGNDIGTYKYEDTILMSEHAEES